MRKLLLPLILLTACTDESLEIAVADLAFHGSCVATKITPFSSDADEGRLVFSLDGRDAYFHRLEDGVNQIYESHRRNGQWSTPVKVPFSTGIEEFDPFLSLDGRTLYYTSFRPVPPAVFPRGDGDLWKVERTAAGWGEPVNLADVNTTANEFFPSLTLDGTLYFNSDRPGGPGAWDLYVAERQGDGFTLPHPLPGRVNTAIWEYNPSPSPGGALLAFGSLDPDPAAPYADIFFAVRFRQAYGDRIDAGPCVNTELEEYHPTLDVARGRLVFVRRDPFTPGAGGDFYEVKLPAMFWAH